MTRIQNVPDILANVATARVAASVTHSLVLSLFLSFSFVICDPTPLTYTREVLLSIRELMLSLFSPEHKTHKGFRR